MTWNSTFPNGNVSVKANETIGQANTTYIENTMGNAANNTKDHFWNVSSTLDGYHRSVTFPLQAANIQPANASLAGVLYCILINNTPQLVFNNTRPVAPLKVYQITPFFVQNIIQVDATYGTFYGSVPQNVYGEIFAWTTALGKYSTQTGYFRSDTTTVEAWSVAALPQGTNTTDVALKFANGSEAVGLNILAKSSGATAGQIWNYRITYRAQ